IAPRRRRATWTRCARCSCAARTVNRGRCRRNCWSAVTATASGRRPSDSTASAPSSCARSSRGRFKRMLYGKEHVQRYRETGGEEGHDWRGTQTLLLTTRGRHSGEPRELPLIYGRSGDDYLIVASKGGSDQAPAWYLNLQADPDVEVQVWDDRFKARARTASP